MSLVRGSLLAAFALLACTQLASGRVLLQTTASTDFTNNNNTYLASVVLVGGAPTTAASADECLAACAADANCIFWSFCPVEQTAGCSVPGFNGAAATTVAAGGCVLSYDDTDSRNAVFTMSGDAVPFVGGSYNPGNVVPAGVAGTPPDANNPATFIDPSGTPQECTGWFTGNQWAGDEIECHVCNGDYQLKCDLDTDLVGDDSVKCEFDSAGLGSLVNNAYEFDCVVDNTQVPQNQCDWAALGSELPACAVEPVRRIMATWRPVE